MYFNCIFALVCTRGLNQSSGLPVDALTLELLLLMGFTGPGDPWLQVVAPLQSA